MCISGGVVCACAAREKKGDKMLVFWGAAIVVFIVIEAATVGITSIWFALGALAALICAALGAQMGLQIVVFIIVSAIAMYFTRPLVKKYVNQRAMPTNADMAIGKLGVVTEEINNVAATGAVKLGSRLWTARSNTGAVIPEGENVVAVAIEGVKIIVQEVPRQGSEEREEGGALS